MKTIIHVYKLLEMTSILVPYHFSNIKAKKEEVLKSNLA